MRVVIDLQGYQGASRWRGIGRYSLDFCKEFIRQSDEDEIYIVLNGMLKDTIEPIRAAFENLIPQEHIRVWYSIAPVAMLDSNNDSRRVAAELIREAFIATLEPDLLIITSMFEGAGDNAVGSVGKLFEIPTAVIIYDLIPLIHSATYLQSPELKYWYKEKIENIKRADCLLAISESSKNEAIKYLKWDPSNICNISAACSTIFGPERPDISLNKTKRFNIDRPYILYVSATDERKNHSGLIKAFSLLPNNVRSACQLVLAGRMPEVHVKEIKSNIKKNDLHPDDVVLTGPVTDEEMRSLYNGCQVFAMPSWHEGFGLPALEAMQCGKATIASNCSSLPEVIGRPDALFDPFDPQDISRKIERVITDSAFRTSLEEHAIHQASKFSWEKSAERAWNFLRQWKKSQTRIRQSIESKDALYKLISRLREDGLLEYFPKMDLAHVLATNLPAPRKNKQLLVDISELVHRDAGTGIQRVVRSILMEWLTNPPTGWTIEPVYAIKDRIGYFYARQFTDHFLGITESLSTDDLVEVSPGDSFIGLDLQSEVIPYQKFILHAWRERGIKINFVVYDLLPVLFPQHFPKGSDVSHQRWLETIAQFDSLICISKAVADDLATWLGENGRASSRRLNISSFQLGADIDRVKASRGFPEFATDVLQVINSGPSFLMVGTLEPRKGYAAVIDAMNHLWKSTDANLIIVGKQGWLVDDLVALIRNHEHLNKKLFWLEGVSDEYLGKIYSSSTALIAASEGEGFGLPLIEAAQNNLPIIARDIPVFREVAGKNACYFDKYASSESIADVIRKWISSYNKNEYIQSDGITWSTWKDSADYLFGISTAQNFCS